MKLEFSRQIFEKTQISNFMKIRPVEDVVFHSEGPTDRHNKANCRSSQFCERSFKLQSQCHALFRHTIKLFLSITCVLYTYFFLYFFIWRLMMASIWCENNARNDSKILPISLLSGAVILYSSQGEINELKLGSLLTTVHLVLGVKYRVSIKYFPDYKHLLQENYCTWNTNHFLSFAEY